MEAAAERAVLTGACRYRSVKSILKTSLDAVPVRTSVVPAVPPVSHDNIAAPSTLPEENTCYLQQPMMEKLLSMRLRGMVEGLKTQEQDAAARELPFLERLALLVDQQWNWRDNQALARRLKAAKLRANACVEDID